MKFVLTGGAGHISNPLAQKLLAAGHHVTVIGRDAQHLEPLATGGARIAIGSVNDVHFLKKAFAGADAVYTMCPASFTDADVKGYHELLGKGYAAAILECGIQYVVNLSSVGAHLAEGAGPVSGLYRTERELNRLEKVNIIHIRPTYFFTNFLSSINMIKSIGVIGAGFSFPPRRLPLSHPFDTAAVIAGELNHLKFSGHSVRYVASDEAGTDAIATTLGEAIGRPGLKWVKFTNQQLLMGMIQAGIPDFLATEYVEMSNALDSGKLTEEYWKHRPELGQVKLETFAKMFAAAWNGT